MNATRPQDVLLAEAKRALREVDPAAFVVAPRILRRVIKDDRELTGLAFQIPHRKCYTLGRERLLWIVSKAELGLEPTDVLPPMVILIAQPDEQELHDITAAQLLERCWRLLFHARVHAAFDERGETGGLSEAALHQRIDRIGQVEYDEMQSVLRQENYLLPPVSRPAAYVEMAAVYLELRYFAPDCLPTYFPAVHDFSRIDAILADDVAAAALYEQTRPPGLDCVTNDVEPADNALSDEAAPHILSLAAAAADDEHAETAAASRTFQKLLRKAERMSQRGNAVRAAVLRLRASHLATPDERAEVAASAIAEIDRLAQRLQDALDFDDNDAKDWNRSLQGLLVNSHRGFWNADLRLLYDLQKVCVDHEREIYLIDLLGWVATFGVRPLKRPLPNQRQVLMSKHLRSATSRLTAARLTGADRERLSSLLHAAAHVAEEQLRTRLRPQIGQSLADVGFAPQNLPERVALKKLIEELLDNIVQSGFLTMGQVRDAVSRNNLKLADLASVGEFLRGDQLLRADRRLASRLDGVYLRGEFYLRWLQRLSSLAFGTRTGRFLTTFVLIPFGGAYVALGGVGHLVNLAAKVTVGDEPFALVNVWTVAALGMFILALLHVPALGALLVQGARLVYRLVRGVLIDAPRWMARLLSLREMLHTLPVLVFRRFIFTPLVLTFFFWKILPWFDTYPEFSPGWAAAMFLGWNLILNSPAGREIEEVAAEEIGRIWYRIRVGIFVALFELVMDSFKRLLESIERVLYAVDEWLRFKAGETHLTLALKAVLGVAWSIVAFVVRIYVNLLIEPQVNPIKHFPVVTVSHKIILPASVSLTRYLRRPLMPLGAFTANTIAGSTVFLLPGIFGFLVWELKENWRVYAANRPPGLLPVMVGAHGETLLRLMKPGLYSGTLPRLYRRLRRAHRNSRRVRYRHAATRYLEKLHHLEIAIRHFVRRELLNLLDESDAWGGGRAFVGSIEIASNSMRIEICRPDLSEHGLWLAFQEQSGWLVASVIKSGWLLHLNPRQLAALRTALAGFYKMAGVDLVREQIEAGFEPQTPAYDICEQGLKVWPGGRYETEVLYNLSKFPVISPTPRSAARSFKLPALKAQLLLFNRLNIAWSDWVAAWEAGPGAEPASVIPPETRILPDALRLPLDYSSGAS